MYHSTSHRLFLALVLTLSSAVILTVRAAEVCPPHGTVLGKTMGEWVAAWNRWAAGIETPRSPLVDTDGSRCHEDQSGPVFFLCGNLGGTTVRSCTVPCGKLLFFPVVSYTAWNDRPGQPGDCPIGEPEKCRQVARDFVGKLVSMSCTVDGVPVPGLQDHLEESPFYDFTVPDDNPFSIQGGRYEVGFSSGYWLMLKPLPPGNHEIRFSASGPGFSPDVTYHLKVEACSRPMVFQPHAQAYGRTLQEWTAEWWKWVMSIPVSENPVTDPDGRFSHVGQTGPVFFLAGNTGGKSERASTVPCGKPVFFSILNGLAWNEIPGVQGGDCPLDKPLQCRQAGADWISSACVLECEIDGVPVEGIQDHQETSPQFQFTAARDNLFSIAPEKYEVAYSDGYWFMLSPLSPGTHWLHARSKQCGANFETEFTFALTVEDCAPSVFAHDATPYGRRMADWAMDWWIYLMDSPAAEVPCTRRQPGVPVFMAAGAPTVGTATSCSGVPCGSSVLSSNVTFLAWNERPDQPGDCRVNEPEKCRQAAQEFMDTVSLLELEIDGVPTPDMVLRRYQTPFFEHLLPQDNKLGIPPGKYDVMFADGFWVMTRPLAPGFHTLRFLTEAPGFHSDGVGIFEVEPCATRFRRGDSNADGSVDLSDAVFSLTAQFLGGEQPVCRDAADSDDSGALDITDPVHILNYLFLAGPLPPAPGPITCGEDPTGETPDLGCAAVNC